MVAQIIGEIGCDDDRQQQYDPHSRRRDDFQFHAMAGVQAMKCPRWPHCSCIVQGYVNPHEPNNCGRDPLAPRRVRRERRAPKPVTPVGASPARDLDL